MKKFAIIYLTILFVGCSSDNLEGEYFLYKLIEQENNQEFVKDNNTKFIVLKENDSIYTFKSYLTNSNGNTGMLLLQKNFLFKNDTLFSKNNKEVLIKNGKEIKSISNKEKFVKQ